jgi:predicted NBD/HSP70 family sugar kinase
MRQVNLNPLRAASNETARDINRRIVLNLIRTGQPISRADLARRSGLQRSTVSLIIEELIADKWVIEGPMGRLPRGRRPTFLNLNDQRAVICVDLRPTRIALGVADVNGGFSSHDIFATPSDPAVAVKELARRIRAIVKAQPEKCFEGVGVSLPGRVDLATHHLVFAPNLGWPPTDLKTPLERATGLEVELENAANACALAEMWFNPAQFCDLVAVTVSEGIGTGIVAQGQLVSGRHGMAGEFGHVPLDPNGPQCHCGNKGCWEMLASNRAALQGDVLAGRALNRMATQLGRGARMIVGGLAPEAIVFIGEFTSAWDRFRPILDAEIQEQTLSAAPTLVLAARDGATARVRGTMVLVLQKHFGAPSSVSVAATG